MVHILNHDQFGCGAGVMQQIRLLALLNIPTALVNTRTSTCFNFQYGGSIHDKIRYTKQIYGMTEKRVQHLRLIFHCLT